MTRARYEIEFQGSRDGTTWIAYPFRYKPQDPAERAGDLRALPAALRVEPLVRLARLLAAVPLGGRRAEVRLLEGSPDVLALFRRDPFAGKPPAQVRAVLWQYWFTTPAEKRRSGGAGGGGG